MMLKLQGIAEGNLLTSYMHLSFSGFRLAAQRFVSAAKVWMVRSDG